MTKAELSLAIKQFATPRGVAQLRRVVSALAVRGLLSSRKSQDDVVPDCRVRPSAVRTPPRGQRACPFDIPRTWRWASLGGIAEYDAGEKCQPGSLSSDRWLLDLQDIEKETGRILSRHTVGDRVSRSTKSAFRRGDILYGKLRPYLNKVVVADQPGYSTTEIVAIRTRPEVHPQYVALAIRGPDFVDYASACMRGTKMPRLRTADALAAPIPVPPYPEQRSIVRRVKSLMSLCDRLEAALVERDDIGSALAKAMTPR